MAVAALKGTLNCEHHNITSIKRSNSGRRRVFVQTETGSVVGLELDPSDNAQTVKKRLQLALNVPTEETSLVCGDLVLKNDLSTVRNDSPLLLTRKGLQRSSSTPCLSPSGSDIQEPDQSGPIEIIGCWMHISKARKLVREVVNAIECDISPVPVSGGLGGAYYFKNCDGLSAAILKPTDEEPLAPNNPKGFVGKALGLPGLKNSVRVGETGFREVAAYLLDHDGFAKVPLTALVKVTHPIFNINSGTLNSSKYNSKKKTSKIASFQQFIPHDFDASDYGTSSFPVSAVHRIGMLDVRILNTDRHAGNLLVKKLGGVGVFNQVDLIPIDHGLCLPEDLEDPYFEWIHWPQASIPFSEDELKYIEKLDPFRESDMLRMELPVIREACLRVLTLCTIFLKEAAGFGLCLAEIGEMMSREFQGHDGGPSEIEMICIEARNLLKMREIVVPLNLNAGESEEFLFDLDEFKTQSPNGCNSLFRLDESDEDDVLSDDVIAETNTRKGDRVSSVSKLSVTVKGGSPGEKSWKRQVVTPGGGYVAGISSGNRSVNEQLISVSSYVKVSDMEEEEWLVFLGKFQRLLHSAFVKRRAKNVGFRQIQRLGTSCKF